MGRSEREFYEGTLAKTLTLIELHGQFKTGNVDRFKGRPANITSMRQIPGLI